MPHIIQGMWDSFIFCWVVGVLNSHVFLLPIVPWKYSLKWQQFHVPNAPNLSNLRTNKNKIQELSKKSVEDLDSQLNKFSLWLESTWHFLCLAIGLHKNMELNCICVFDRARARVCLYVPMKLHRFLECNWLRLCLRYGIVYLHL